MPARSHSVPGGAAAADDAGFAARTIIAGTAYRNDDLLRAELKRARHALAYLKGKIGNDAMRELLADALTEMTVQARNWMESSNGAWQSAFVELILPGPDAVTFRAWYAEAMADRWEQDLRAGHPEHFINHPRADAIEVIENVGETELP